MNSDDRFSISMLPIRERVAESSSSAGVVVMDGRGNDGDDDAGGRCWRMDIGATASLLLESRPCSIQVSDRVETGSQ